MTRQTRDFRPVLRPVGAVMMGLSLAIVACAAVGAIWDSAAPDPTRPTGGIQELLVSAAIAFAFGIVVFRTGPHISEGRFLRRHAVLAVALIWFVASVIGALPFVLAAHLSPVDALFESVSGLTTTGATVITDIETRLSRPILLWRSLIQWLGGMGIVVLFVAVFPNVGAGGKHMFRGEVPGTTAEGLKPRIAETSFSLWRLYAVFTLAETVILSLLGMDPFEALCHAFTTLSTGGFSTRDASVGAFDSASIDYVIATFMFIGAGNYGLYYMALRRRSWRTIVRSLEFRTFVGISAFSVLALTITNVKLHDKNLIDSFRYAYFMVGTIISSTGYGNQDYSLFQPAAMAIVLILMFIGGCSGSTAGGIKVERIIVLAKQSTAQIRKNIRPTSVQLVRVGRSIVNSEVLADVGAFFTVFMGSVAAGVFLVSLVDGVPVPTSFGAVLSCLSNMGPAPFYQGADNFADYTAFSKIVFVNAMLLGRLEFFTLLALLLPGFWKR
ncbi:MAG: TrkH family potassium uptake protein [Polyangiales bacterium]